MTVCSSCNAENPAGHKFCGSCGTALAAVCSACGTANEPGNKFCYECGSTLEHSEASSIEDAPVSEASASSPVRTERRFVSVLFADLVSFTSFSEGRDSEDVRSMLTIYFDRSKEIIELYGGQIDKFIGDAVMGVWGAVESNEDDAERATRAALELVDMVAALGAEIGVDELAARVGVLSGETAVGPGGNEKGLVVGDLVNTASRLQSIAPPGSVFVGAPTRDLIAANIETQAAGEHLVKGKEIPVEAFEAIRVISDPVRRAAGELLEGPFVGRGDELRLLKDQLHAAGREGRARLVSIVGEGGIGKTRLSLELLRYIDGIAENIYYHHGRSPSYGEGVTFWALGEMIRQRAGIAEGEDPGKARIRLRTMVAEFLPDDDDQRWIEPRLAALIGIGDMPPGDRPELFAALRAFFQAIAERGTVLMVFEDMHWADDGLVDFVDELVERTTKHAILVITLARPDLLDRRPDWGSQRKRMVSMHLSRLEDGPMRDLVAGLAPGLPETMVDRVASRTAGVPLHAVEFIRMLVNSGQLVREEDRFRFDGDEGDLAVPDSLNAIIGARLDRLSAAEIELVQDASVLGYSFTLAALAAVRGAEDTALESAVSDLVRREVLEFEENPRSPERGQYRFVQSLIREVAYGRLTKAEKVSRHLSVAKQMSALEDPEVAGVIASHYANAAAADPSDESLARTATEALIAAAERASDLHSYSQAVRLFDEAIELTMDESEALGLLVRSSTVAALAGFDNPHGRAEKALEAYRQLGDEDGAVAAVTVIARFLSGDFRSTEAADIAVPVYRSTEPSDTREWALLAAETARALMLSNRSAEAVEISDMLLPVIARLDDVPILLDAIVNLGTALANLGRRTEGIVFLLGAVEFAKLHDMLAPQLRAMNNLNALQQFDELRSLPSADDLALILRAGDQGWITRHAFFEGLSLLSHGRFDDTLAALDRIDKEDLPEFWADWFEIVRIRAIDARDGFDEDRTARYDAIWNRQSTTDDPQLAEAVGALAVRSAFLHRDFGRAADLGFQMPATWAGYPEHLELALMASAMAGDVQGIRTGLSTLQDCPPGRVVDGLMAFAEAFEAALSGDPDGAVAAYLVGNEVWAQAQTPEAHAVARAVAGVVLGPSTTVGAEAAGEAFAFFDGSGATLFLDLFADLFATLGDQESEGLAG